MNSYKDYYSQKHCNPCKLPCQPYTECESIRYCCPRLKPKYNCVESIIDVFAGLHEPIRSHPYNEIDVFDVFSGHADRIHSVEYRKMPIGDVFACLESCV